MRQKVIRLLKSESGESSYIGATFYILITVILIVFVINVFQIISVKQQMDHMADQLVKQIQLSGQVNCETEELFQFLRSKVSGASNVYFEITTSDESKRIQIGTPFYVTIRADCMLGGNWRFNKVKINMEARGAGVSEHYWKD